MTFSAQINALISFFCLKSNKLSCAILGNAERCVIDSANVLQNSSLSILEILIAFVNMLIYQ
jgi:hypothetical protein